MKILVLCHGNINRSPLCANVLLTHKEPDLYVRQAAIKSIYPGWKPERASKKMRDAAKAEFNIDLSEHKSRKLTREDIAWADFVIYMDNGNLSHLEKFAGTPHRGQTWIALGDYATPPAKRIPDPAFMARESEDDR